jgi:hypothetical protein
MMRIEATKVLSKMQLFEANRRALSVFRKLQRDDVARPYVAGISTPQWKEAEVANPSYQTDGYYELNYMLKGRYNSEVRLIFFIRLDGDEKYHVEQSTTAVIFNGDNEPLVRDYSE